MAKVHPLFNFYRQPKTFVSLFFLFNPLPIRYVTNVKGLLCIYLQNRSFPLA